MPTPHQLATPRLLPRPFTPADHAPFAAMNADPLVMQYFASTYTRAESEAAIARYAHQLTRDGFSFLVAEHRATSAFVGILGLQTMHTLVPNLTQPAIEIGWRLDRPFHNQGLATEGARALVQHAFIQLQLPELVAITATGNIPSRHVMEKLGMHHRPELIFDHPNVPAGHPHQQHVLYSLANPASEKTA